MLKTFILTPPPHTKGWAAQSLLFAMMAACSIFFLPNKGFGQMNKWILKPAQVDFGSQTAFPLTWLSSTPYTVENAVFGPNGNPRFYIRDASVFQPGIAAPVGTLPSVPATFCGLTGQFYAPGRLYELGIVPVPGSCTGYFVFWCSQRGVCGTALAFSRVDVPANGTATVSPTSIKVIESAGAASALAISKPDMMMGNRHIYWIGGLVGIREYVITVNGPVATFNNAIIKLAIILLTKGYWQKK